MFETETHRSNLTSLYRAGGVAALVFLVYSLITMVLLIALGAQPETAEEGFAMLRANRVVGLLRLDVLTIFVLPLYYLLYLALCAAVGRRRTDQALLVAVLAFSGITLVLATPSALSFVVLGDRFAAADAEQQAQLLAAGEAILASDLWHGSGATVGAMLLQVAGVLVSVAATQGEAFRKSTAYLGVVTHGLDLAHILLGLFVPSLGVVFMAISGPLYLIWFPLLAGDLLKLSRTAA